MNQEKFLVAIIVILLVGGGFYAIFSQFNQGSNLGMSPTPTAGLTFNNDSKDNVSVTETPATVTPSQKLMKQYPKSPDVLPPEQLQNKKAIIQTNKGVIEFEIFSDAPKTASNFIFLARDTFYDGLTFHRVVPGFVIQGGDPAGNGSGGPGYKFEDEKVTKSYNKGIVAMANSGPNTNGSQFFIMLEDNPTLPPNYTIFGQVISGQDVVSKIVVGDIMQKVLIQNLK